MLRLSSAVLFSVLFAGCTSTVVGTTGTSGASGTSSTSGSGSVSGTNPATATSTGSVGAVTSGETSSGSGLGSNTGSASSTGGSATGAPDAGPPPLPVFVGIIGTGQSLSVGVYGFPVLSTSSRYGNLKLEDDGPDPRYAFTGNGLLSLVPLVEPIRPQPLAGWNDDQYPNNIYGETPHTSLANQLTALSLAADAGALISVQTVVGWSGHCMSDIDKEGNGRAYPGSLDEVAAAVALAPDAGHTMRYDAVVLTHGECDSFNLVYEAQLLQLWFDYAADVPAITGQDSGVVLIESQQESVDPYSDGTGSMLQQWQAGVDYPGKIVCAGPKYQYGYAPDDIHLPAPGYIRLGAKYGEVIAAIENRGGWTPLQPSHIVHAGNTVTVSFQDSFPPLNWDDDQPAGHQTNNTAWALGRGFEVTDLASGVELPIVSAALSGDDVVLTLGDDPDAGVLPDGGILVGYAMIGDTLGIFATGTANGRHGALRDSDSLVGVDVETLVVSVTNGSTLVSGSLFPSRALWDRVTGDFLAAGTVVTALDSSDGQLTLSQPWTGQTGTAELTFWHDQRNYCVDFQLRVP